MRQVKQTETESTNQQPLRDASALVSRLSKEECEVYNWLLQAYSIGWIAETLGMESRKVRAIAAKVYQTLEVSDQRELIRYYITLRKYDVEPKLSGEDFACAMASYTDRCAETMRNEQ